MNALDVWRTLRPAVPFILVADELDEGALVRCLRAGAADVVLKRVNVLVAKKTLEYAQAQLDQAKVYFQELLKRYPKTNWKKDANDELKKLTRDQKNKAACSS